MAATTFGHFYVTTDEVGKRIAGYTVRHRGNTTLCATMAEVEEMIGFPEAFCWASLEDAKVHYTRQPEEVWGFATESVTVRHWDSAKGEIAESVVYKDSIPFDRYDFGN